MTQALQSKAAIVQVATWNDWGEGTVIEPSREFGYRDLEMLQKLRRRHIEPRFSPTSADLRLPFQLLHCRRAKATPARVSACEDIAKSIAAGKVSEARSKLEEISRH